MRRSLRFNGSQNIRLRINCCPGAVWSFVPDTSENQRVHNSWRPRQDTEFSMAEQLHNLEASFIANGVRLGLEGDELREHLKQRLRQYGQR